MLEEGEIEMVAFFRKETENGVTEGIFSVWSICHIVSIYCVILCRDIVSSNFVSVTCVTVQQYFFFHLAVTVGEILFLQQ